jgi:vitamin B12 transporter
MRELFAFFKQLYLKKIFTYLFILALPSLCFAQVRKDTLADVKVVTTVLARSVTTPAPVQTLTKSDLSNSISIADALKTLAGVQVKDYGGVGGLKTISIRSLGANHTGVLYDGLILGDAQGGQTDLGKFSIDNVEQIRLYNSNASDILLPARAFASATLLQIKTSSSIIEKNDKKSLQIKLQQGSFGYFSPAFSFKSLVQKNIQMNLHGWAQTTNGAYTFKSYENNTLTEKRNNADVKAYRLEYDAFFKIKDSSIIKLKSFYYNSKRGLPGYIILYNSTSNQRLQDENFFIQTTWQHSFNRKKELLLSTKFSSENNYYLDPLYPNSVGKFENKFQQQEMYASLAYKYNFSKSISASISSDVFNSTLIRRDSFVVNFATPSRNTFLQNAAFKIKKSMYDIQGNVLFTTINEKVQFGNNGKNVQQLSPAISASIKPFSQKLFYVRAFYKNIFRAPTFNDLYYTNIGNTNLLPEYAEQFNVGLTFQKRNDGYINQLAATVDVYLNNVKDKILAVPRQNLFQWSMQNIAAVKIKGLDATIHAGISNSNPLKINSKISYTFQEALDVSNKAADSYNTQLPYTPVHTGNVQVSVQYKKTIFLYSVLLSSYKYTQGQAIAENLVQGFSSSDFSISYLHNSHYKLMVDANNIFNTQYEIIRYYPMPRFNYRITLQLTFKNKHEQH